MITLPDPTSIAPLLTRWERFGRAITPDRIDLLQTEDVVAALLDRSMLQQELDAGVVLDATDLVRLDTADRALRAAAPLLEQTEIALYRDEEPVTHWWWHIEQIVLGTAGELLLTVPQAAQVKGVHPHTIRAAIRDGHLPARRLARGFLVHRRDLERWEPRRVGRPGRPVGASAGDPLLDGFNAANTAREFEQAARIAAAIERDPSTPRRRLALALTAFNRGDHAAALRWAEAALAEPMPDRSRQTAGLVRGRALLELGHPRKARAALTEVRSLGAIDAFVLAALADVERALGSLPKAVVAARAAVAAGTGEPELTLLLARMEWQADLVTAALEHVSQVRAAVPDSADAAILYGAIMGVHGDRTGEAGCYERAVAAVAPWLEDQPEAARIHGTALARMGRLQDAIRHAARMHVCHPDEPDWDHALRHLAEAIAEAVLEAGGDHVGERLDRLERAVAMDGPLAFARARQAAIAGDLDRCLSLLELEPTQVAACDPEHRATILMAGLRAGRPRDVLALAALAIEDDRSSASVRQVAVSVALAADDLALTTRGLGRLAAERDLVGLLAQTALAAMDAGERHGREEVSGAVVSGIFGRWTAESTLGSRMSPVDQSAWSHLSAMGSEVDDLIRGAAH